MGAVATHAGDEVEITGGVPRARRLLHVEGIVQGVGFRPFVHGLAVSLGLGGFVRNESGTVRIEVEGTAVDVERFAMAVRNAPAPARVERVGSSVQSARGERVFRIEPSAHAGDVDAGLSPDVAVCDACMAEVLDPNDRRFRYPFAHCARCGPRYAVALSLPYDRERTTMAAFELCRACRAEYEEPTDRRFHAQAIACPACGPRMRVLDAAGNVCPCDDAARFIAGEITRGAVVAIKGVGGYHLACDASNERAVALLRARKNRGEKPFAVMVSSVDSARALCEATDAQLGVLASPARPIVLLPRRAGGEIAPSVAPACADLGVLLPYAPVHHLVLRDAGCVALVMTSGNTRDEPIVCDDAQAITRLSGIADFFLTHDRVIHRRCDDSVVRAAGDGVVPVRRARGYTPERTELPGFLAVPTLAVGGHGKVTVALGRDRRAHVGPHVGDLGGYETAREFEDAIARHEQLFALCPERLVHDLHPDYGSTRYAIARARRDGLTLTAVQHHHAHMAGCLAEHGFDGRAIGIVFDGAGAGEDGCVWGGEFLVGDAHAVRRAGHLAYVAMPGGERAAREPWRMAAAHAIAADETTVLEALSARVGREAVRAVEGMIARGINAPRTSSVGRLFDAMASMLAVCDRADYEGEAPARLEALARVARSDAGWYECEIRGDSLVELDAAGMIRGAAGDLARGIGTETIARRFHRSIAKAAAEIACRLAANERIETVALSGGVFVNAVLADDLARLLETAGLRVFRHQRYPCNDGGLSFGQLAVVAARDAKGVA